MVGPDVPRNDRRGTCCSMAHSSWPSATGQGDQATVHGAHHHGVGAHRGRCEHLAVDVHFPFLRAGLAVEQDDVAIAGARDHEPAAGAGAAGKASLGPGAPELLAALQVEREHVAVVACRIRAAFVHRHAEPQAQLRLVAAHARAPHAVHPGGGVEVDQLCGRVDGLVLRAAGQRATERERSDRQRSKMLHLVAPPAGAALLCRSLIFSSSWSEPPPVSAAAVAAGLRAARYSRNAPARSPLASSASPRASA